MSENITTHVAAAGEGDKQETKKTVDVREQFTNRLIQSLENGVIPWRKDWKDGGISGMPRNAISGKDYKGGNRLILLLEGMDRGYADPRWLTFKQAQELGGGIAKGEHGVRVEYWDKMPFWKRRDVTLVERDTGRQVAVDPSREMQLSAIPLKDGATVSQYALVVQHEGKQYSWKQAQAQLDMLYGKSHVVFNVDQCRNLSIEPINKVAEIDGYDKAKAIVAGMESDGVKIQHPSDRAFYRPGADTVTMPAPDQFTSPEAYYSTLLHELGHATGHKDRLDRPQFNTFGSEEYAKEELVAELASAFTSIETGLKFDDANHAAYVGNWLQVLKNDKNEIFRAAKAAGQAADFMMDRAQEKIKEIERGLAPEQSEEIAKPIESVIEAPVKAVASKVAAHAVDALDLGR